MALPKQILVVDDERPNRTLLRGVLESLGYSAELAADGLEALAKLRLGPDLILLDVMMPGMDGFEVAERIRRDPEYGDVPIVMVTMLSGKEDRLRAVEAGANDFITKPIDRLELRVRVASLLKTKDAQDAIKRHTVALEAVIEKRTTALRQSLEEIVAAQREARDAYREIIHRLVMAAESKDGETGAHIQRVADIAAVLARALRLPPGEVEVITEATPMHDIGKLGIPDAILGKQGRLDEREREIMNTHTTIAGRILGGSSSKLLQAAEIIAVTHHEKWDGSGYPKGLAGEDIPLWGRICAVADVFDSLTTNRVYRAALPNEAALDYLKKGAGTHFDPGLVELFVEHLDEVRAVQERYAEEHEDPEGKTVGIGRPRGNAD